MKTVSRYLYGILPYRYPNYRNEEEAIVKYDVLDNFRKELYDNLSANTARKYYSSIVKLFQAIQFSQVQDIPLEYIEQQIKKLFASKNEFSAVKNSLKRMKQIYPELKIPSEEYFKDCSMHKRNCTRKPKKVLSLQETKIKIERIENKKLKMCYKLALAGGFRVSELEAMEKKDIRFADNGKIYVMVTKGKGGSNGEVECTDDKEFSRELQEFLHKSNDAQLFYSEEYIREKAYAAGFEPHDLRRMFAQIERKRLREEMSTYEANKEVQHRMRHARFSTTKRYLFNRKLKFEEDF